MKKINLVLLLCLFVGSAAVFSQNQLPPVIQVQGEGVVRIIPDEVTINIRVEHSGDNTGAIKSQNDAVIREVLKYVKKTGIPDKDVRTEYMNLTKNYDYNTKTYSYVANQSLSIKLRDLTKYETLMNGLLQTGINRIDGVQFSSSKIENLESEARKKAILNAKKKAEEYVSVLNQQVGKAISISENSSGPDPRPMYRMAAIDHVAFEESATIAPGELEIRTRVNVVFELK